MSSTFSASFQHSSPSTSLSTSPVRPSLSTSASSQRSSISSVFSQQSSVSSTMTMTRATSWNAYSTCACPAGSSFFNTSYGNPGAFLSDEDLFGDDDDAYLSEPPPPPRPAEAYLARPLLPPVVQFKPRQCSTASKKKRRSSSIKTKE